MADTITQEPVSFPSTDAETTIHGYIWRDEGCASPRGIIQIAHGMAEHIDRYIWPGPMPSAVENNMKIALENIFYNGEDVETALQNAEDLCNEELAMSEFVSVESQYQYADEAK